jgi:hypothetical protein
MRAAIGSSVAALLGAAFLCSDSIAQSPSTAQVWGAPTSSSPSMPPFELRSTPPAPEPPVTRRWVHLEGPDDLKHLREINLNHYLRAQRILKAANEICQPETFKVKARLARFSGEFPSCQSWMTSYPPKKWLRFHLDDVGYIALVSVNLDGRPEDIANKR